MPTTFDIVAVTSGGIGTTGGRRCEIIADTVAEAGQKLRQHLAEIAPDESLVHWTYARQDT